MTEHSCPKGSDLATQAIASRPREVIDQREDAEAPSAHQRVRHEVDEIPLRYYTLDFIHLTREGHAMIAAARLRDRGRIDGIVRDRMVERGARLPGRDRSWCRHCGLALVAFDQPGMKF
jgi:hypothetical protein